MRAMGGQGMALDMDMAERRAERRHTILIRANIELPDKQTLSGHAVDVSRGGMGLQSPMAMNIGQELTVIVPLEACGQQRLVSLPGKVCYCKKQSEKHFRIGLQFVHLDEDTQSFINALCP